MPSVIYIFFAEPHKRVGSVQCMNGQEFGHSKAYRKLPTVYICGELYEMAQYNKPKTDSKLRINRHFWFMPTLEPALLYTKLSHIARRDFSLVSIFIMMIFL